MRILFLAFIMACSAVMPSVAMAKSEPVYTGTFNNTAVGGYDAVSYFTNGQPAKGKPAHAYKYQGATWLFSSAENLAMFVATPDKYAPQYGGYCAYGLAQGALVSADPTAWKIVNDKLYLNYDADVQADWSKDASQFITTADQKWPAILAE